MSPNFCRSTWAAVPFLVHASGYLIFTIWTHVLKILNMCTDDVPAHQPTMKEDVEVSFTTQENALYVNLKEDANIFAQSFHEIRTWCKNNNMLLSESKTQNL